MLQSCRYNYCTDEPTIYFTDLCSAKCQVTSKLW
jgi:hypothetical protein